MPITSPFFSRFFFVGPNYGAPTAPSWKTSSPAARFSVNNSLSAILFPKYLTIKQSVFQKIAAFVEKFKGVGGEI